MGWQDPTGWTRILTGGWRSGHFEVRTKSMQSYSSPLTMRSGIPVTSITTSMSQPSSLAEPLLSTSWKRKASFEDTAIDLLAAKWRKLEKACFLRLETLRHIELFVAYAQRVSSSTPNHQETSSKAKERGASEAPLHRFMSRLVLS